MSKNLVVILIKKKQQLKFRVTLECLLLKSNILKLRLLLKEYLLFKNTGDHTHFINKHSLLLIIIIKMYY